VSGNKTPVLTYRQPRCDFHYRNTDFISITPR
jgi:hypothetical protein